MLYRSLLALVFFSILTNLLSAHDLGVARLDIWELDGNNYIFKAKIPKTYNPLPPILPERCISKNINIVPTFDSNHTLQLDFNCSLSPLDENDIITLPWERDGVFVSINWKDNKNNSAFFGTGTDQIAIPISKLKHQNRNFTQNLKHYLFLGIEHILIGWDHLAFILAICLISSGWNLVKLVTAFTLGHSFTLALASLGITNIPIIPVEACIALSIAIVAREAILNQWKNSHGAGLVFLFGLLHGLGFASVLSEVGIEKKELLFGLVSFNIGVEIGQLFFVIIVLFLFYVLNMIKIPANYYRYVLSIGIGIFGIFLTIERIYNFTF